MFYSIVSQYNINETQVSEIPETEENIRKGFITETPEEKNIRESAAIKMGDFIITPSGNIYDSKTLEIIK